MSWSLKQRIAAFLLGFSSIAALIAEFYGVATLRGFSMAVTLPCFAVLAVWAARDRQIRIGLLAGFAGAIAYDVFRLPIVMLHILPLFKVFVRFGAMLLGQPIEQADYSVAAHLLGWLYHFSNALGFGVMYMALVGNPLRRHWAWAVAMSLVLEIGLLFMPYAATFSIRISPLFIVVTVAAHAVFGVVLGLTARYTSSCMTRSEAPPSSS